VKSESLKISGMTDEGCADKVEQALKAISGVNDVTVSLAMMEVTVQYDDNVATRQHLQTALLGAGYGVEAARSTACHGTCCGSCGG
jgi:copper chaperone